MGEGGERTAMSSITAANPCIIQFTVKTPTAKKDFMVPENITIKLFKEVVSKHFHCQSNQLVLVFFGRILKDQDTLRQLGIHDGATVHMVIRRPRGCRAEGLLPRSPPASARTSPVPPSVSRTSSSTAVPARSSPSESDTSAWSAEQPSSAVMVQALESLFAQSLLSSPELMRQLIMANPQMQQLAQQIPEINHILNNTHVMKEMLDMVKNSDMLREMRSWDRAVSSHERVPGGDSALVCTGMESQDTTLTAMREQFGNSSFASLGRKRSLERTCRRTQLPSNEAREHSGSPSPSHSATSIGTGSTDLDTGVTPGQLSPSTTLLVLGSERPGAGGVQNMLHQVTESLQLIVNLCAFYTKWMTLLLLQRSHLEAEASRQQQDAAQRLPDVLQRIQNPEMLAAMSNPKAMQACLQIEQGLQVLALEAPVLIPWFSFRLRSLGNTGSSTSAANGSAGSGESPPRYEPQQQSNDDV
ncbi:ubiquilin-1-like [Eudromia elegans]